MTDWIEYVMNNSVPSRPIGPQTEHLDIRFQFSGTTSINLPSTRRRGMNLPLGPDIAGNPVVVRVPNPRDWEYLWSPEEWGHWECVDECGNDVTDDKLPGRKPPNTKGPSDTLPDVWNTTRPPTFSY